MHIINQYLQTNNNQQVFMATKIIILFTIYLLLSLSLSQNQASNATETTITQNQINQTLVISSGQYNQSYQLQSNSTEDIKVLPLIFGVRWFLGDYFSYANLVKTHLSYIKPQEYPQNNNYYILAFNTNTQLQEGIFLEIGGTEHPCSYVKISIPFSNDHTYLLSPNNQTNSTDTHIYKCNVNMDLRKVGRSSFQISEDASNFQDFPYKIFRYYTNNRQYKFNNIKKLGESNIINKQYLYNCSFRAPLPKFDKQSKVNLNSGNQKQKLQQNAIVFGDWSVISKQIEQSKGYIPIIQSAITRIQQDKNLIMIVFLGDIAYDFISDNYFTSLRSLQPLTSRVCFMATPGNHQYYYHADSFEIFTETFLSPQWSKYFNIYYTFVLGDYLFISYQPQNTGKRGGISNIKPLQYMLSQFYDRTLLKSVQINKKLNSQAIPGQQKPTSVSDKYHVIVFSHYPVICSKQNDSSKSCTQNQKKLRYYMKTFTDIGMDLYLSAHVHYYDRTHSLCWDPVQLDFDIQTPTNIEPQTEVNSTINKEIYQSKCPIFIVQGAGGNQYFVQEQNAIKPLQISSKLAFRTGYGILTLKSQLKINLDKKRRQIWNNIEFSHYKMIKRNNSILVDKFSKLLPLLTHNHVYDNQIIKENKQNQTHQIKTHKNNSDQEKIMFGKIILGSFTGTLIAILLIVLISKKFIPKLNAKVQNSADHKNFHQQHQGPKSESYIVKEQKI